MQWFKYNLQTYLHRDTAETINLQTIYFKTGALFKQILMRCKYHVAVFTCQGAAYNVCARFINYVYCRQEKAVGAVKLPALAIKCDFIRD